MRHAQNRQRRDRSNRRAATGWRSRAAHVAIIIALAMLAASCGTDDPTTEAAASQPAAGDTTTGGGEFDDASAQTSTGQAAAGGDSDGNDDSGTDGADDGGTTGAGNGSVASAAFPRSITYGVLHFEVSGTSLSDAHPNPDSGTEGASYLAVDMVIDNPLHDVSFQLPVAMLGLEYGDDEFTRGFAVEGVRVDLPARDDQSVTIYFEIDEGEATDNAVLVIEETDFHPARLPLTGGQPAGEGRDVQVAGTAFVLDEGGVAPVSGELAGVGWVDHNVAVVDGDPAVHLRCGDSSGLGRARPDVAFLHMPATVRGRPDTVTGVALSFNAVNFSIGAVARVDGVDAGVCQGFGDLSSEKNSEFQISVPLDADSVTFRIGCPCAGLLTYDSWEDIDESGMELLRIDVAL